MRFGALSFAALALTGCATQVQEGARFATGMGGVTDVAVPVRDIVSVRFAEVVRQRFDFSCGSAALATLLRYHYDFDVGEEIAFRGMWLRGDQAAIRRVGFSLLDMKRWLATRGLTGDGYKVTLDQIAKTGVPGIALIAVNNYRHFVVLKGVHGDEVLVGDPSAGITVMSRAKFEAAWNGIYFVLSQDQPRAKQRFNRAAQWAAYPRAPIGTPFSDPVSQQALALTAPARGDI
jgi:hypothetical protein